MDTCTRYRDQIWDQLYGLLEEPEARLLNLHVDECFACRESLAKAHAQQQSLARAARVLDQVPAFELPGQGMPEPETVPVPLIAPTKEPMRTVAETSPAPATLPMPIQRRSLRRAMMGWLAAAAAVAALIVGFQNYRSHQNERAQLEGQVAQGRRGLQKVESHFAALQKQVAKEQETQSEKKSAGPTHVQVAATATYHPQAPLPVRVLTRDVDGQAKPTNVRMTLSNVKTGEVLHQEKARSEGDLTLTVPAGKLTGDQAKLVVAADEETAAQVVETLQRAEPSHVTHLALNKSIYQIGEVAFFRSLTLERFTMQPPAQNVPLRFSLLNAQGQAVKQLSGQSKDGGIGGGEFALTDDVPPGSYSLQVTSADPNVVVAPQARFLEIQRPEAIQVATDRLQYAPGDRGNLGLQMRNPINNQPLANQQFKSRLLVDGQAVPLTQGPPPGAGGPAMPVIPTGPVYENKGNAKGSQVPGGQRNIAQEYQSGKTDAAGNAQLQFNLPNNIPYGNALIELSTKVGKNEEKVLQAIPVQSSQPTIDFFPEGGDLVAGVTSKVYYRVRSPLGEPMDPQGHVIVMSNLDVVFDSERGQGSGWFNITPKADQEYLVRITGPATVEIKEPFQKLAVKKEGVVLHVPTAVAKDGDTIPVVVRASGADRRLMLTLTCRGQLIRQHFLATQAGDNQVNLPTDSAVQGVLRLTVYELGGDRPRPVAERLLYRGVAQRLDVTVQQQGQLQPGQHVRMNLGIKDEAGKARPAWMLAAVVDERFRAEKNETSLPAFFHLASEVGGDELEDMPLALNDTPAALQGMDLFLGTTGWRRFLPAQEAAQLARADDKTGDKNAKGEKKEGKDLNGLASLSQEPVFFSRENQPRAVLRQKTDKETKKQANQLAQVAQHQRAELLQERERLAEATSTALLMLEDFDQRWAHTLRRVFWASLLTLATMGGLFLAWSLVNLARKRRSGPALIGSFACLALALVLFLTGRSTTVLDGAVDQVAQVKLPAWPDLRVAGKEAEGALAVKVLPAPPVGYFAAAQPEKSTKATQTPTRDAMKDLEKELAKAQVQGELDNLARNLALNNSQAFRQAPAASQERRQYVSKELQDRFAQAAKIQAGGFGGGIDPAAPGGDGKEKSPPMPTPIRPADPKKKGEAKDQAKGVEAEMVRAYAHRTVTPRVDLQDTVLWQPNLFAENGQAQVDFDLSGNITTYRFLIYANGPDGRLGFYEGRLEVRKK